MYGCACDRRETEYVELGVSGGAGSVAGEGEGYICQVREIVVCQ